MIQSSEMLRNRDTCNPETDQQAMSGAEENPVSQQAASTTSIDVNRLHPSPTAAPPSRREQQEKVARWNFFSGMRHKGQQTASETVEKGNARSVRGKMLEGMKRLSNRSFNLKRKKSGSMRGSSDDSTTDTEQRNSGSARSLEPAASKAAADLAKESPSSNSNYEDPRIRGLDIRYGYYNRPPLSPTLDTMIETKLVSESQAIEERKIFQQVIAISLREYSGTTSSQESSRDDWSSPRSSYSSPPARSLRPRQEVRGQTIPGRQGPRPFPDRSVSARVLLQPTSTRRPIFLDDQAMTALLRQNTDVLSPSVYYNRGIEEQDDEQGMLALAIELSQREASFSRRSHYSGYHYTE